jgi:hypothetical protein
MQKPLIDVRVLYAQHGHWQLRNLGTLAKGCKNGDSMLSCIMQGYSGMNRFNKGNWSMVQNSMVMAYLSYADFYRPRYWLLENVRNFVSHNKSFTFRLTVRTLLEMGYQVLLLC